MGKHKMMVWKKGGQPKPATDEDAEKTQMPAADRPKPSPDKAGEAMPKLSPTKADMAKLKTSQKLDSSAPAKIKTAKITPVDIPVPDLGGLFVPPPKNEGERSNIRETPTPPTPAAATVANVAAAIASNLASSPAEETPAIQTSLASIAAERPGAVLEAALFMSGQALTAVDLAKLIGSAAVGQVEEQLSKLSRAYETQGSALEVVQESPGKWVMRVRAKLAPAVRGLAGEAEIPKHALRTLAYISKNDGIKKRDLFNRLGSTIYEDVGVLIEKGFVAATPAGRTVSLRTTPKFKQYFEG